MASLGLQVFISSKMRNDELRAERAAAVEAVNSVSDFYAWHWETCGPAGPNTPMATCLAEVEASDALILLVGYELTQNTIDEHQLAISLGRPDFIFVKKGKRAGETKNYLIQQQDRATYNLFETTEELKTRIIYSLRHERARRFREYTRPSLGNRASYARSGGARRNG